MVPTSLVLTDSLLLKATKDSKLMCFGGFQANAGAGGAILLKLKREVFSASLGTVVFARSEKRANLESIRRFLTGILLDKKTSISQTTLTNLIGRLADSATAIESSRQAMLTSRAGHLGILRTGSVSIIAKRTGLRSGSEKMAVISDPGSIVNYHSSGSSRKDKGSDQTSGDQALSQYVAVSGGSLGVGAAGSNSKKRVKRKKTTFAHQTQVTSATATVVYVPLSALEVGSGNHSLRTKLANIVSEQNTERLKRLESAQGVLKNMDKSAEADHDRRRSALKSLSSGLKQAEALKAHVNDFMDWKKDLDKSMEFDDLNLSPARPSLTVTSPSKLTGPRWSWSHQQRDLTGNERFSARRDADMLASPSKYAVASNMGGGRHTFYQ